MSEHFFSVRDEFRRARDRTAAIEREYGAVDSYYELDEIQLIHRYDEMHEVEQWDLFDEQRQMVAFISKALLERIEHKITPSFRRQLEQEAQLTNEPEEVTWVN
ncbi:hypothetical protein J2X12_003472 [Pseudarthrobacter oxydans]|uniref:Uncharacterized protein n=2 Tax=Pseudarthrobacter oxydans TaxID=1671 RepID=A0AAW8NHN6_PSEOX|nr:hypothetical protein [Pseudarthrobacter oxydans]MDR6794199.1 hypothetical protein [Pseudarthrobacter oxydans]MDR7165423.1 hypothetical protein [Pseudarthrobacter oxydans]